MEKVVPRLIGYSILERERNQPVKLLFHLDPYLARFSRYFREITILRWEEVSDLHPIPEEKSIDLISASFTGRIPSQRLR